MEQPRLTSVLRAVSSGGADAFDVDRLEIDRNATLSEVKRRRAASEAAERAFTWDSFSRGAAASPQTRVARSTFHRFLSRCAELFPGEPGSDELAAMARQVYSTSASSDPPPQQRESLSRLVGPLEKDAFRSLRHTVAELEAWRAQYATANGASTSSGPSKLTAHFAPRLLRLLTSEPYGADVPFLMRAPPVELSVPRPEAEGTQQEEEEEEVKASGARSPPPPPAAGEGGYGDDAAWLLSLCSAAVAREDAEPVLAPDGSPFSTEALAGHIADMCAGPASNDALQAQLLTLLGFSRVEEAGSVLQARRRVAACAPAFGGASTADDEATARSLAAAEERRGPGGGGGGGGGAVRSGNVVVRFGGKGQSQKQQRRRRQQQAQWAQKQHLADGPGGKAADAEAAAAWLEGTSQEAAAAAAAASASRTRAAQPAYSGGGLQSRKELPVGSERKTFSGWEQITVPPRMAQAADASTLVPVSALPPDAQAAFPGTSTLNRLQSRMFEVAFRSAENLLVCAPTGAGKTNVAVLTILRQLAVCEGGPAATKVVYVAPMKALAQEVVSKFRRRLAPLSLRVAELTGDMQMTRREMEETQVIVTTPEKWDVVTRKGGEGSLAATVQLLILDEVHLLADSRGPVIETLVARTLRAVEASQRAVRIAALSATLPNYRDVAEFLGVNPARGLMHADDSFRPVPLTTCFVGIAERNPFKRLAKMNEIAYGKACETLRQGKQVMVFVHSRKDTVKTAEALLEAAAADGQEALFASRDHPKAQLFRRDVSKSKNRDVGRLFPMGLGVHHAGMLRSDRTLTERMFEAGVLKVIVCTATLAWGVNLPAHTVIIKGTQVYNADRGGFTDVSILDVQQVFGRAGRPQYDTSGLGIILTSHDKMAHYLRLMTQQAPIESRFVQALPDHLNAEIVSGTVTSVRDAVRWLAYTYLYVRMCRNPMAYGISYEEAAADPTLAGQRDALVRRAAARLDECRMIRYDPRSGTLAATHLGRVASHFYLQHDTIECFNEAMRPHMTMAQAVELVCRAGEFEQLRVREEELEELERLRRECPLKVEGGITGPSAKANVLLQCHISWRRPQSFTLISDTNYVAKNSGRVARGLFEICVRRGWSTLAERMLTVCKAVDWRVWWFQTPLRQFPHAISHEVCVKVERAAVSVGDLVDMSEGDVGAIIHHHRLGSRVRHLACQVPHLHLDARVQPLSRSILRMTLTLAPDFTWSDRAHGSSQQWHIWVLDAESEHIYHSEVFTLHRRQMRDEPQVLAFAIPIFEPLPPQYFVRAVNDHWLGSETTLPVSFHHLMLPDAGDRYTELQDLQPLPTHALRNAKHERMFPFSHFNAVQTQLFWAAFHSDKSLFLGAPTGSGKTVVAELAILRMLRAYPGKKAVYIAPLKALVRERMASWRPKFAALGCRVVELTGDVTPDMRALRDADILITTPEKWDGVSRQWRRRDYVRRVQLVVIDEIHLLGEDRGPVLEVIVSRMRYVGEQRGAAVRVVGLSTAVSNPRDLADWLGIDKVGLYNFRPSVRPVPLEVHIAGYPGRHYCPRMATMNRPTYAAIRTHSPTQPVLVFVSSRRQTRLTALDLIALAAVDDPRQWLRMGEEELTPKLGSVRDAALRQTLAFGVGIHHAGLDPRDRTLVESLFVENRINVLVSTSTLAWGVNFPAHLVVVKGTEYFDGKLQRYVDFPITDVLQMMGRAGRPQFDRTGIACVLVHEPKKNFYRKFLYEPFPVESSLHGVLHDHINAEVSGGTICSRQDAVDFLTWTFFFRRLLANPSYYGLEDSSAEGIHAFLVDLVDGVLTELQESGCLTIDSADGTDADDDGAATVYTAATPATEVMAAYTGAAGVEAARLRARVAPTVLGHVASAYYLHYRTVSLMEDSLEAGMREPALARLLCDAHEFDELPVRHNEELLNAKLAMEVPWKCEEARLGDPHEKAFLLVQAHFAGLPLPIADYANDTRSVLDQVPRVLNAMVDVAADKGLLDTALAAMQLSQLLAQGAFPEHSTLLQLPHIGEEAVAALARAGVESLAEAAHAGRPALERALSKCLSPKRAREAAAAAANVPRIRVEAVVRPQDAELASVTGGIGPSDVCEVHVTLASSSGSLPRGGKKMDSSWWLVLGDASGELHAVRRTFIGRRVRVKLLFEAPPSPGDAAITLYLISDALRGVDQQRTLPFTVVDPGDGGESVEEEEEEGDE